MSDTEGFRPGVPCWVETWHDDPEAAIRDFVAQADEKALAEKRPITVGLIRVLLPQAEP